MYDLDGDGTITKSEMLKIVRAISAMTGQTDPKFSAETRVEKIFQTMDVVSAKIAAKICPQKIK